MKGGGKNIKGGENREKRVVSDGCTSKEKENSHAFRQDRWEKNRLGYLVTSKSGAPSRSVFLVYWEEGGKKPKNTGQRVIK